MEDGPPGFPQDSTCPMVLGNATRSGLPFAYRAFTFCGAAFQPSSAREAIFDSASHLPLAPAAPHYPADATPAGFGTSAV